ncbi:hypothetical protein QVD17_03890 [Tagetes erecta]|uniref:HAT C-terminal dimerisation domain-containing protein n=1 Tax=Tagetes erecta TaxID=13708 RepID=A0AAD8LGL0_TARER|nr:hypothetical protein QVD17_03890 [Tagetes erecta]
MKLKNMDDVKNALEILYNEYVEMYDASIKEATSKEKSRSSGGSTTSRLNEEISSSGWDAFGEFLKDIDVETPKKSELIVYLEGLVGRDHSVNFNVLDWLNTHKLKYRVLSSLASETLAVPISTVASETTFSAGVKSNRSTLEPRNVEMLICGGDWIRQKYGTKKKLKIP